MRTTRVLPIALASVLTLAVTGCGDFKKDEPQTAVRDFISEALVQENGQRACDYLTQDAQNAIARTGVAGEKCRESMERANWVYDGEPIGETAQVKDLDFSTEKSSDTEAVVTVKAEGGGTMRVTLKHDEGLGNLYEPVTPWRITGGVEPLTKGS
jgi:hypothetical protein